MVLSLPPAHDTVVATLGACLLPSPLLTTGQRFVDDSHRVLLSADSRDLPPFTASGQIPPAFEVAGPRSQLFFDPATVTCGIVTCGGICPGVNDVIRSLVLTLTHAYGVRQILGFRYGYAGLVSQSDFPPLHLTPAVVDTIHQQGGTLLGTSRGPQDIGQMVDTLVREHVGILFTIGGDGTLHGAIALSQEIQRRHLAISIIAIPKTIDNDLTWVEQSFGFATAVEAATAAIQAAHTEARGAWNGIGLVKLMGRHSGFIAAHASLANSDVNFCLVPESPFLLAGERGFLPALAQRLAHRHHAVIVVAEGAGQAILQEPAHQERDASGNLRLKDIGVFLRDEITRYFSAQSTEITLKYIDPSYLVRGVSANAFDSQFCLMLGQHAVHAGMAGRTAMLIGYWHQQFTHVPLPLAVARRKQLDPRGTAWQSVLQATGQATWMADRERINEEEQ
ncbi:MAG: ATP-dependent 6-phosphofructokinase [Deltaproteobacteria bacterium]|nr:ATP-dependent 6-phosphofructokinase [Deltaproteobacteria bacterium]